MHKHLNVIPMFLVSAFLIAGCGSNVNSAGLTESECQALEAFADEEMVSDRPAATLKFWDLEKGVEDLYRAIDESNLVVGSEGYLNLIDSVEKQIEKRRQDIANQAGEISVSLKAGALKTAMINLAQSPSPGNLGAMRGLARACNLTSD